MLLAAWPEKLQDGYHRYIFPFSPQIGTDALGFAALSDALITRAQNAIQKKAAGRVITVNKAHFANAEKVAEYDTRDVVMLHGRYRNIILRTESCGYFWITLLCD